MKRFLFFGADTDTGAMTPGRRIVHRIVNVILWIILIVVFAFGVFIPIDFRHPLPAMRYVRKWVGRRELTVRNLNYALSPDRSEIVMTYEIRTSDYDMSLDRLFHYTYNAEQPASAVTDRRMEKRIPLEPMSGEAVKCIVEVVVDPAAKRVHPAGEQEGVTIPFFVHNLAQKKPPNAWWDPEAPPEYDPSSLAGPKNAIPDGRVYRLLVHPDDEKYLSGAFLCGYGHIMDDILLMIPYDRDEDGRYVMISQKDATTLWPFMEEPLLHGPRLLVTVAEPGPEAIAKQRSWIPKCLLIDFFVFLPSTLLDWLLSLLLHLFFWISVLLS